MPSGSRDQWNLIRLESCAASSLERHSVFPRWSGLLYEHRGIADHHLRSQEACDAYINRCVSSSFDLLKFLILLPPRFPPASMTETKAESQNTFANPYNSVGSLPFDTNKYVISAIPFHDTCSFSLFCFSLSFHSFRVLAFVTCQTATRVCHSIDGSHSPLSSTLGWIVLSPRSITPPFPMH